MRTFALLFLVSFFGCQASATVAPAKPTLHETMVKNCIAAWGTVECLGADEEQSEDAIYVYVMTHGLPF